MKFKRLLSTILAFGLLSCGTACAKSGKTYDREFDNVILVIGDGMGENHILNCIDYFDLDVPVFMADQNGYINTDSLDGLTDSAAGATALATGQKVLNGNVAKYAGNDLEQITDIAQEAGMKTGVITTDTLNGATPASFSANADSRNALSEIIRTQAQSEVDLLLGRFEINYQATNDFTNAGYAFACPVGDYQAQLETFMNEEKVLGNLSYIDSEYITGKEDHYQLKDMAKYAVEFLENDKGFFLMIEGAYIDKYSHGNAFHQAMSEMRSLIDTIAYLYEYAADGKTAIFITADHETGGLQRATTKEEMSDELYTTGNHTDADVPLFVKNYNFDSTNFGYAAGVTPENTVVFSACKRIITGE